MIMSKTNEIPTTIRYFSTIEEANDGSGDGILTFPDELIKATGWKEGDTLNLIVEGDALIISVVK
jgi:antitoxin component of MazEF toxin-antitoxin module